MISQTIFPDIYIQTALKQRGFKVGRSRVPKSLASAFGKRHFYKIVLSIGNVNVLYGDQLLRLDGTYLFISNPYTPYSVEVVSEVQTGYSCLFTQEFIQPTKLTESMQQSVLFDRSASPAYKINDVQLERISQLFEKMIVEEAAEYEYKDDVMRLYISMLLHETIKMKSDKNRILSVDASYRITKQFLELLERQFPIESLKVPLRLHTAQDFANHLGIHVNSLNRAVKKVTGKTTTLLISDRIAAEAKALLGLTDWNIAEIAYALGFEYPNYFSTFMKKNTGKAPKKYRKS